MLEELNLRGCGLLTDLGFLEILSITGKLRVLDVSWTKITEPGFTEGISLPMLQELNLDECVERNDSGLLEILSITGNRMKTVNVFYVNRSDFSFPFNTQYPLVQYPLVQFKYSYFRAHSYGIFISA